MSSVTDRLRAQLEDALSLHRRGELAEAHLQDALQLLDQLKAPTQDLLYVQAASTSPFARLNGINMICDGRQIEMPRDPDEWPYQTVMDALRDGWRIISFPNPALLLDDEVSVGLGCEFILER